MIPLTFTWLCLTNFADLYREFLKKNPNGINMVEFINYALDNPRLKCAFMLRYYDRETKSIKESFFTTKTTNPYFQQVLGFTFKDAVGDCMVESVKKLLKKETYDEYSKDGIPMAYVYTRSFVYEYNKDKGTVGLYAFKINDDLMTGLSYSKGDSEIMYLPNKMDKELMESKVIKDLIAWK